MRDDRERVLDILEAIERIQRYTAQGRDVLACDELIQNWVVHHLQIVGEAARAISPALTTAHPEVPWSQIIGMRNILVHHYFNVDVDVLWTVVERDLPDLKSSVEVILASLPSAP